jgi:hypothetical protein
MDRNWNSRAIDGRALVASWTIAAVVVLALSLVPNRVPLGTDALNALASSAGQPMAAISQQKLAGIDHFGDDCGTCPAQDYADERC